MKNSIEMSALLCLAGLYMGVVIYLFINRSALLIELSYRFVSIPLFS